MNTPATPGWDRRGCKYCFLYLPIEFGVRSRVRVFIETMMEEELDAVLSRPRYGRRRITPGAGKEAGTLEGVTGHRHGHRSRSLLGTFGPVEVSMVPVGLHLAPG